MLKRKREAESESSSEEYKRKSLIDDEAEESERLSDSKVEPEKMLESNFRAQSSSGTNVRDGPAFDHALSHQAAYFERKAHYEQQKEKSVSCRAFNRIYSSKAALSAHQKIDRNRRVVQRQQYFQEGLNFSVWKRDFATRSDLSIMA